MKKHWITLSLSLFLSLIGLSANVIHGKPYFFAFHEASQSLSNPVGVSPVVEILAPSNGTTFSAPASFSINAYATDSDGWIVKVECYAGSTLLGNLTNAPYSFYWPNVAQGVYSITVKATDNDGNTSVSSAVKLIVNASKVPNQPPSIYLTAPQNNALYTAPAIIQLSADASDSDGNVVKVEFYNGATLIGVDKESPFGYVWNNVPIGSYRFYAKAYDDQGASKTSASVMATVQAPVIVDPCQGLPQYVEGSNYAAGNRVKNVNVSFQCKPWPYALWCNGASWAYAPGTGIYWMDAWQVLDTCKSSSPVATSPAGSSNMLNIYPNPIVTVMNIEVQLATDGWCRAELYTPSGDLVKSFMDQQVLAGDQVFEFSVTDIPKGVYYLHYILLDSAGKLRLTKSE